MTRNELPSMKGWARGALAQRVCRALAYLAGIAVTVVPWHASAANDPPTTLSLVWSFANNAIVYPCYDQTFAIIYFSYDPARKVTSIRKKELNGDERVIAEFPGVREPRSLSCSQDGKTIAAVAYTDLNMGGMVLFLQRGDVNALYKMPHYWAFSRGGTYALLAPDGNAIALPEVPTLIAGTDLLRDIKIFFTKYNPIFVEQFVYKTSGKEIVKYEYANGKWEERSRQVIRSSDYLPEEIVRCGDHDVVSLLGADDSRVAVLGEASPSKQDWLGRIGVRKLFDTYEYPRFITGSYGACAFLLHPRHTYMVKATGLVRFDGGGVQMFTLPYGGIRSDDEVYFSKDGCHVLLQGGWPSPGPPGNIHLLAVNSPRCG